MRRRPQAALIAALRGYQVVSTEPSNFRSRQEQQAIASQNSTPYRNECGDYELVAVESDSWVDTADRSFDGLGMDSKIK